MRFIVTSSGSGFCWPTAPNPSQATTDPTQNMRPVLKPHNHHGSFGKNKLTSNASANLRPLNKDNKAPLHQSNPFQPKTVPPPPTKRHFTTSMLYIHPPTIRPLLPPSARSLPPFSSKAPWLGVQPRAPPGRRSRTRCPAEPQPHRQRPSPSSPT